eukprot:TRINITY_DN784_c0_g1_i5.p2 TRINITY_DN784_c0_g1~~TRINITY_DN784_c0_g1_i5.p2  ORF type:complete len:201 (-),score=25.50 TRINITY_DN784_c0_g1_i5:1925-2527(-)
MPAIVLRRDRSLEISIVCVRFKDWQNLFDSLECGWRRCSGGSCQPTTPFYCSFPLTRVHSSPGVSPVPSASSLSSVAVATATATASDEYSIKTLDSGGGGGGGGGGADREEMMIRTVHSTGSLSLLSSAASSLSPAAAVAKSPAEVPLRPLLRSTKRSFDAFLTASGATSSFAAKKACFNSCIRAKAARYLCPPSAVSPK